jgi:YVTN family beta-propeller protein
MDKKILLITLLSSIAVLFFSFKKQNPVKYVSPSDIEVDISKGIIYVSEENAKAVKAYSFEKNELVASFNTTYSPKALKIAGDKILVATSWSESELIVADRRSMSVEAKIKVGKGACDIALKPDLSKAYVANQYSNSISVVDLNSNVETKQIDVLRQPMVIDISKDGKYLFVANFLTAGRADVDTVTCEVSIIDLESEVRIKDIPLANGSNALRGICVSADGRFVFVSHNLGRFQVPTTQLEQGWMNTSAMSVIDAQKHELIATVLLDEPENGAAGSWGIDCTEEHIVVTHSGTHDFSIIDYNDFIGKLLNYPRKDELSYDLRFLSGLRERIPIKGNGPRTIKVINDKVFISAYFSDVVNIIDLNNPLPSQTKTITLNENLVIDSVRLGEIYFHDATYCFQKWQSCTGCHPNNARTDGLNWDLLNDGMGNPKNCKSMLMAHPTPPAMITGIRESAEIAVRAGFRYIQFVEIEEGHTKAVDYYLKSLKAVPSPYLEDGKLSAKAEKGKVVFEKIGCTSCHSGPYYTDMQIHGIGTQGEYDHQNNWDTPTLIEVWRSGPYLHDGRCATMKEVFTEEEHGIWEEVTEEEIEQLVEYVMSL